MGWHSQHSDQGMGWMIQGSSSGTVRDISLFIGYQGSFPGIKQPGQKLTTQFHLVSRLRLSGAVTLLPLYASMAWAGMTTHLFLKSPIFSELELFQI